MKIKLPPEWGTDPVPPEHRTLGFFDFFVLWSSLGVGLLVLSAGSLLVPSQGLSQALLAIIVGTLIGSVLLALTGVIGSDNAIPTMVAVRSSFRLRGSYLPSALNIFQLIGWTIFEIIIMAQSANILSQTLLGVSNFHLWVIVFTIIVGAMGIGGPLVVIKDWLEKFAIWIVYGTSAWIGYYLLTKGDIWALMWKEGSGGLSFLSAVDIVIAMPISWMPLVADFNRFSKRRGGGFWGTLSGYSVANIWFYALGVLLVLIAGMSDVVSALANIGFGLLALFVILVDETDNAFADVYSAAVSTQNIQPKRRQRNLIIFYTILSGAFALVIPISQYETFLILIGALFIPVFGIVLADYFILKKGNHDRQRLYSVSNKGINAKAILAWLMGVAVYFILSPVSPAYLSSAPDIGASIPSLVIAAVVYVGLESVWKSSNSLRNRRVDVR